MLLARACAGTNTLKSDIVEPMVMQGSMQVVVKLWLTVQPELTSGAIHRVTDFVGFARVLFIHRRVRVMNK